MTDKERLDRFEALFTKLKHNREKVPLSELQGKYGRAYNALIAELEAEADWWAGAYIACFQFPILEADKEGATAFYRRFSEISQEEWTMPGGLAAQFKAALVQRLDFNEFTDKVWQIYDRLQREAYNPYFQTHCRWVGPPGTRWIYNDIIRKFWWPLHDDPKACGGKVGGYWISSDRKQSDRRMPAPEIGPDPEARKKG